MARPTSSDACSTAEFSARFHQPRHIRDRLEADAQRRHPGLAARMNRNQQPPSPPRRLLWQDRVLLVIAIVLMALLLLRVETARADDHRWGLMLNAGHGTQPTLALGTDIDVTVTGQQARVQVRQRFRNDGVDWMEGQYRFPLPDSAAVDRMRITVGHRILEGEIQERKAAEQIYAVARDNGQRVARVDQERANQFATHLANIGPGEDVTVEIGFLMPVGFEDGHYHLQLPMTFAPRYLPANPGPQPEHRAAAPVPTLVAHRESAQHGLQLRVHLPGETDLAGIVSLHHDIRIETPSAAQDGYLVTLSDDSARTDRAFELAWAPRLGPVPVARLLAWNGPDGVYAQLMLAPPNGEAIKPTPREVIFVIDTSGSMEGDSLRQAVAALDAGLLMLGPHDHFNVIEFNSRPSALFDRAVLADNSAVQQAQRWLRRLRANGGTEMQPALEQALTLPVSPGLMRQVVFITDGAVGNQAQLLTLVAELLDDARMFTVGIGAAPNGWFMRKAAEIGRGTHTRIGNLAQVQQRMNTLWSQIQLPAVTRLSADWNGGVAEYYPELVPDLYAGEPLWLSARMDRMPRSVTLRGSLNGADWELEVPVTAIDDGETLAAMWARRKLEALEDRLMYGDDADLVREQALDVALTHGLLSPYTSMIAVDRTPVRATHAVMRSENVPSLLPAGSSQALSGYAATAIGWQPQALLAFCLLLLTIVTYRLLRRPARSSRGSRLPSTAQPPRGWMA